MVLLDISGAQKALDMEGAATEILGFTNSLFYDDKTPSPSRFKIAEEMIYYLEDCAQKGIPINIITQNMLGLFHGCRGAKIWRSYLSHQAPRRRDDPRVLSEAINLVLEAQSEAA